MGYLSKEKQDELNRAKRERGIGNLGSPKNPFDYYEREYGTVPQDTKRAPFQWVSEVAYKNVHRIVTRGYDTTELMEEGYGVIEVLFVDYQARIPTEEEGQMLNYVMIMALEDGLSAPAAISRIVAETLESLNMKFPEPTVDIDEIRKKYHAIVEAEGKGEAPKGEKKKEKKKKDKGNRKAKDA